MSQINLTEMADILPALVMPIESNQFNFYWGLISVCVILLLLFLLWRYIQQPLRQLKRQLLSRQISTREASHQLDKIVRSQAHKNKNQLEQQLKQIRFQRQSPDMNDLLSIIEQYQHAQ